MKNWINPLRHPPELGKQVFIKIRTGWGQIRKEMGRRYFVDNSGRSIWSDQNGWALCGPDYKVVGWRLLPSV